MRPGGWSIPRASAVVREVAHDVGPRAMTAKVKGYVQPKSWFIDLTTVSMQ